MFLHRNDIKKLFSIVEKFPYAETFELEQISHGIGSVTSVILHDVEYYDEIGQFKLELSGEENW